MENLSGRSRLRELFKGGEIPDVVYVPPGAAYYRDIEDIPTESIKTGNKSPNIDRLETRSFVVLSILPPLSGEPEDASFRVVGDRGLYVRAILDKRGEKSESDTQESRPELRWVPFNKMDQKKYRYL